MKRKLMKSVILSLSLMLLCLNMDTSYIRAVNADSETTVTVKNHGVNNVKETPSALNDGQVWTNKEVADLGNGEFEITLSVWAKGYKDGEVMKNALQEETILKFTDVIGNGFAIDGELPTGIKQESNLIIWNLAAADLALTDSDSAKASVSFKVKYVAAETGTYYTNEKAEAMFTPNKDNPFYYDVTDATDMMEKVIVAKSDMNWELEAIKSDEKTTGWIELETVTEEKIAEVMEENNNDTEETSSVDDDLFDPNTIVPFTDAGPLVQHMSNYSLMSTRSNANTVLVKNEGIQTAKSATFNEQTNTANISLEAFTTGNVTVSGKPVDVVLVLDQSTSMETGKVYDNVYQSDLTTTKTYYIYKENKYKKITYNSREKKWQSDGDDYTPKSSAESNGTQFYEQVTKLEALKRSVNHFLDQVEADAKKNNVQHRVAIVGFAIGSSAGSGYNKYQNTEILSLESPVNYENIKNEHYKEALKDVSNSSDLIILNNAVGKLEAEGSTNIDLGMEMAYKILQQSGSSTERNKVVVAFTDGLPTSWSEYSSTIADNALNYSYSIKNLGATVYSIGVVDGADPNANIYNNPDTEPRIINKFLHLLSSNYSEKYKMNTLLFGRWPGHGKPNNKGYYLAANDTTSLSDIFEEIYSQIHPNIDLGANTQLIDKISDYFKTPITPTNIKVYTSDYKGGDYALSTSWGNKVDITSNVSVSVDGDQVVVTGFDYNANVVTSNADVKSGKKLVVEISNVTPIDGFIGGNQVPTNKSSSGVYSNENVVENFDQPSVDIPIKYEFKVKDKSIYIGDDWKNFEKFLMNESNKLMYSLTPSGTEYELGNLRNDFVDITYEIKKGNDIIAKYTVSHGSDQGTLEILNSNFSTMNFNDTETFNIEVKVSPISSGSKTMITKNKNASLYVFTPKISVTDETIFYGDLTNVTNRYDGNKATWSCIQNANAPLPDTDKPVLNITARYVKDGSEVNSNEVELSGDTQFKISSIRRNDTNKDIINGSIIVNNSNANDKDENHDFTIYVLKGQLNIKKTIDKQYTDTERYINANQTFVYLIERRNEKNGEVVDRFYQTIDFSANESITEKIAKIKGLKKGYYDVTELTEWSWKYELQSSRDDYSKNTDNTTVDIYIGDDLKTGEKLYYGVEENTVKQTIDYSNPSNTYFVNHLNDEFNKMFSDVASAINKFISSK